jgi:hypothetical protein
MSPINEARDPSHLLAYEKNKEYEKTCLFVQQLINELRRTEILRRLTR